MFKKVYALLRYAYKLDSENKKVYQSFTESLESASTCDYVEVMGILAHKRQFKTMISSLFVFKNRIKSLSYAVHLGLDHVKFGELVVVSAEQSYRDYKQLLGIFGSVVILEEKRLDMQIKQRLFELYDSINKQIESLPDGIKTASNTKVDNGI